MSFEESPQCCNDNKETLCDHVQCIDVLRELEEEVQQEAQRAYNTSEEGIPQLELQQLTEERAEDAISRVVHKYWARVIIGEGGYAKVYKGYRRDDKLPVAVKVTGFTDKWIILPGETSSCPLEVGLMKMVSQEPACPSIIKLLDWCEAEDKFVLIMERPKPCKNLYEFVMVNGGFGEVEARRLFRQLVEAHQHCEARGVFHRDLKPDNVIIQTSTHNVKLTDFGCGSLVKDAPFSSFIGAYLFAPPECFRDEVYYPTPFTVWTLAINLLFIVDGHLPFENFRRETLAIPDGLSSELRDLIQKCLNVYPENRPTLEEILEHPWMC